MTLTHLFDADFGHGETEAISARRKLSVVESFAEAIVEPIVVFENLNKRDESMN